MTAMADYSPHRDDVALLMIRRDDGPSGLDPAVVSPGVPGDLPWTMLFAGQASTPSAWRCPPRST